LIYSLSNLIELNVFDSNEDEVPPQMSIVNLKRCLIHTKEINVVGLK